MDGATQYTIGYPGHEVLVKDIVRAENCDLYDPAGNRYVDLESGVWCTSIGHGHPRVLQAIAEQSARIVHTGFSYASLTVEEAAREILSLLGFENGRCVFLCSGSEAVEYGVRTAKAIIKRPLLMTMADSYLGAYGSASRKEADEWFCFDWAACATCPHEHECDERCQHWQAIPWHDIGGFVFEPGSSSGFVRFPPQKLIHSIVTTVKETDGLILVNEVTTGIGRTGTWFGYQHYDIAPHVVAMGKGIGNGYPVSVTAFAASVIERLGHDEVKYGQSHQNDPLGAAVARQVVRVIQEDGLIERGRRTGALLLAGLEGIKERTHSIKEIRARGLMLAIELHDDAETSFTAWSHRELARRGYLLDRRPHVNVLRLDPSLTIEQADIEGFLQTFEQVLTDSRRVEQRTHNL